MKRIENRPNNDLRCVVTKFTQMTYRMSLHKHKNLLSQKEFNIPVPSCSETTSTSHLDVLLTEQS